MEIEPKFTSLPCLKPTQEQFKDLRQNFGRKLGVFGKNGCKPPKMREIEKKVQICLNGHITHPKKERQAGAEHTHMYYLPLHSQLN